MIVDGGNSNFHDSQRRYADAKEKGIKFVDAGVSGGVWGLANGYCLMVGRRRRRGRPGRAGLPSTSRPTDGYAHVGAAGAGHFTKMVHNGIEYGLMQAYAEGFEVMKSSEFDLDLHEIAGIWRYGSVVRSWLLELLYAAFEKDGAQLEAIRGYVEDSGEGRWTIAEAIAEDVPVPVITAALFARFASRQDESFAAKVNAALRNQFGGHAVEAAKADVTSAAEDHNPLLEGLRLRRRPGPVHPRHLRRVRRPDVEEADARRSTRSRCVGCCPSTSRSSVPRAPRRATTSSASG